MYRYFYFPDRVAYGTPADADRVYEDVRFHSADGTVLAGWFMPAPGKAHATVVHMHGNAQNMSAHWPYAEWLLDRGFNVFTFDYRGYGNSQGSPDPAGILADAIAALDYLRSRDDTRQAVRVRPKPGRHAGDCRRRHQPGRHPRRARRSAGPFIYRLGRRSDAGEGAGAGRRALRQQCTSQALSPIPLLLMHSLVDRVVPYSHSEQLLANGRLEPKQLLTIADGAHNDAMTELSRHPLSGDRWPPSSYRGLRAMTAHACRPGCAAPAASRRRSVPWGSPPVKPALISMRTCCAASSEKRSGRPAVAACKLRRKCAALVANMPSSGWKRWSS